MSDTCLAPRVCTHPKCERKGEAQPIDNFYKKKEKYQTRCKLCVRTLYKEHQTEQNRLIKARKEANRRNACQGHE